jgi:hypothetical protein
MRSVIGDVILGVAVILVFGVRTPPVDRRTDDCGCERLPT